MNRFFTKPKNPKNPIFGHFWTQIGPKFVFENREKLVTNKRTDENGQT